MRPCTNRSILHVWAILLLAGVSRRTDFYFVKDKSNIHYDSLCCALSIADAGVAVRLKGKNN